MRFVTACAVMLLVGLVTLFGPSHPPGVNDSPTIVYLHNKSVVPAIPASVAMVRYAVWRQERPPGKVVDRWVSFGASDALRMAESVRRHYRRHVLLC